MQRYYPLTQLLVLAGGFIVVTTFAFSSSTATAIDFAIAIATTLVGLAVAVRPPVADRARHRAIGGVVTLVSAWTILVTLGIFTGATQRWLDFAAGAVILAAGLAAGALYEAGLRRGTSVPADSNGRATVQDPGAAFARVS